jgi:hypothetical protein
MDTIDFAEIRAERVSSSQEIEKKARSDAVLIAKTDSAGELNRGLLF